MTRSLNRRSLVSALLLTAALAPAFMAGPSSAAVVKENGKRFGFAGHHRISDRAQTNAIARAADSLGLTLGYQGGPVLHSSAPYLVFWDPAGSFSSASRQLAIRYFADVAHDSGTDTGVNAVARQYTDSSGFAGDRQTFDSAHQAMVDNQPFPPAGCSTTGAGLSTCITDGQVTDELSRLISSGSLPTGTGTDAPIYFVVLPPNVNECTTDTQCASNSFCGYHSYMTAADGSTALYAVIPSVSLAGGQDPKACQWDGNASAEEPNHDGMDVLLTTISHEDNEAITDPLLNAWVNADGNENADRCAQTGRFDPVNNFNPNAFLPIAGGSAVTGTAYTQTINGDHFYLQSEWSNGAGTCAASPTSALAAAFTAASAGSLTRLSLDPQASHAGSRISSVTWSFGDGSAPVFTATSTLAPVVHDFGRAGTYTVSLTVVDNTGNKSTVSQPVLVGADPAAALRAVTRGELATLSAAPSHAQSAGASLAAYSWSFGDGASATGPTAVHTYAKPGRYTVTLTVADSNGQKATATETLLVRPTAATAGADRRVTGQAASVRGTQKNHWRARKAHRKARKAHRKPGKAHRGATTLHIKPTKKA